MTEIDSAEHDALRAEREAENLSELAFETTQLRLVRELEALAQRSQERAQRLAARITEQAAARRLPSASSHQLYQRAACVAHLADRCARSLAAYRGYALEEQARSLCAAALAVALPSDEAPLRFAAGRIEALLRNAVEAEQERAFAASSGHED